jgi:hypothetical protein
MKCPKSTRGLRIPRVPDIGEIGTRKSIEWLGEVANYWQARESSLDPGMSMFGLTALGAA